MKILQKLQNVNHPTELVEIGGRKYIRKTLATTAALWNEKAYIEALKAQGMPTLSYHPHKLLKSTQLLLTYVPKATVIGNHIQPYDFFQMGKKLRQMHSITYPKAHTISPKGKEEAIVWGDFIKSLWKTHTLQLPGNTLKKLELQLTPLFSELPLKNSLLHGDLHLHHALRLNNSLTFTDKDPSIFAGDKLYDLGEIYRYFAHLFFIPEQSSQQQKEREFHKAFVEGYHEDPLLKYRDILYRYILLRSVQRASQTQSKEDYRIIELLMKKLS